MTARWTASLFLAVALLLTHAATPFAQSAPDAGTASGEDVVEAIRIEGTNRIEQETVRSYLLLRLGDKFTAERMDKSLKSLFVTGLFNDVKLFRQGNTLIVRVEENPIINRVAFEGNDKLDDDELLAEVQLRPRVVYTRTKVQSDTKRLLDLYRASGRFAATVEPKVIPLEQNRVDLVFEINEGDVTGIRRITFIGNRRFDDGQLKDVILTKESAFWRILSTDDTYDPDRLTFDQELLRKFYLSKGYADFRNVSVVAELTPDRDDFFVTFTVEEGERYKFGAVGVTTNLKNVDVDKLNETVSATEGEWYDGDSVEDTITNLTDEMGTLGYAFVEVRPRITRDRDARTVGVDFQIQEGPRVFVERINIMGNSRTRDEVIRRELRFAEGDAFNTAQIRDSRRRIRNLDFFDEVEINNVPGSAPDRTIVNVEVKEKSTGELSIGAGFSSADGAIGTIGLRERNFLGRGQDVGVAFSLSQRTQSLDLSFTEPKFLERDLSAGIDLFRLTRDFEDEGGFDQRDTGFRLRGGYELGRDLYQNVNYTLQERKIKNVEDDASIVVKRSEGKTLTSSVGQRLLLDKVDDRRNPSEGYLARLNLELAGLGGRQRFVKPEFNASWYYPILDQWVFSLTGRGGIIRGINQDVRISDRFFIGQNQIRGFAIAGIGPRDAVTDDALGANSWYGGTVELSFPLPLPKEFPVKGRVFTDIASAFDLDEEGDTILNEKSPRLSAGFGITWDSPFGPVLVDLGVAIIKEDFDDEELFRFSFGTRF
ncbi:MAG: outer membrane protein assembly factor BamA [Alphaproteobacteria bacterium]|nr:outer membrane protein assembly factor BamA [Alphaproteobacteria bacterium]